MHAAMGYTQQVKVFAVGPIHKVFLFKWVLRFFLDLFILGIDNANLSTVISVIVD